LSVGRGTAHPFAFVGAPWLDTPELAAARSQLGLPGVAFKPLAAHLLTDQHLGRLCSADFSGARVASPFVRCPPPPHPSEVLQQARSKFSAEEIRPLRAEPNLVRALAQGTSAVDLERLWERDLQHFERVGGVTPA
jgi:hypothetical protein